MLERGSDALVGFPMEAHQQLDHGSEGRSSLPPIQDCRDKRTSQLEFLQASMWVLRDRWLPIARRSPQTRVDGVTGEARRQGQRLFTSRPERRLGMGRWGELSVR